MEYLKTWMGVTSRTMAGRDDGYPEMKLKLYNSVEELARDFGQRKDEKYYELTKVSTLDLNVRVAETLENQKEKARVKKREDIEDKIKTLQGELKKLS